MHIPHLAVVPIDTSICSKPLAYGRSIYRGTERQWSRKLFNSKSKPRDRRMKATNCCLNSFMFAWKPAVISGKKTYLDQRKDKKRTGSPRKDCRQYMDQINGFDSFSGAQSWENTNPGNGEQSLIHIARNFILNSLCSKSLGASNRPAEDAAFWIIPKQDLAPVRVFMG